MAQTTVPRIIDVQALIDGHPLSAVQRRLLLICFLVVAIDGFDTALSDSSRRRSGPSGASPCRIWARCLPRVSWD